MCACCLELACIGCSLASLHHVKLHANRRSAQSRCEDTEAVDTQVGKYNPAQRAATVLYRGTQFFVVSFAASMLGHSLTKFLVGLSCAPLPALTCSTACLLRSLVPLLASSLLLS